MRRVLPLALLLCLLLPARAIAAPTEEPALATKLFEFTNNARAQRGIPKLARITAATDEAMQHSKAMAREGRLWHTSGPGFYNVSCGAWGENVGWTSGSIWYLHQMFMDSAIHRANILNRNFTRVAVGVVRSDNGRLWATVFFCG